MKPEHYQELKQSAIANDVIQLNFLSLEGYEAFEEFVSFCDSSDNRQGPQGSDSKIQNRYSHLYQGYWYAESWCPLTDTIELKQVKPDYPMLRLVTTQGEGKYKQPVDLNHRPDKRHTPREKGYLLGTRQTIISIAKSLKITDKLPKDKDGNWHLEAISAMSPGDKYQWCLENGVFDVFAFDTIKYETPSGSGTPFIYLDIPLRVLEEVANEYQLTLPEGYKTWNVGDKWLWIRNHPQIPLFITEGLKKAASLISHGKIAIACFSITTHSEKASEGKSSWHTNLKPELLWLLEKKSGRLIYLVFDAADVKETSRRAVKRETKKLGKKLKKYGTVKIITWQDQTCKGIDDFIFKYGIDGLNEIIKGAVNFNKVWQKEIANFGRQLTSNIKICQEHISPEIINQARLDGIKLLFIKSQQNTGKSFSYAQSLEQYEEVKNQQNIVYQIGENVQIQVGSELFYSKILGYNAITNKYQCSYYLGFIERDVSQIVGPSNKANPSKLFTYGLTHRQSLAWNLAQRFNLDCYLDNIVAIKSNGIMVCADSSLMIPEFKEFTDMVIDESEQVAWHLLASFTDIRKNRISKIERIAHHGRKVINLNGMITIMDADLSDIGVEFYQTLFGINNNETLVVENLYKPFEGVRDCIIYPNIESLRHQIVNSIREDKRVIIHTSGQKENSTHGTINIEKEILEIFPELEGKIYRLDKESLADPNHLSYRILEKLDRLKNAQVVIASSSINTGVSLDESIVGTFDGVFGIFYGNYPLADFEQAIERYRGHCDRHVYLKNASSERINIGSYKYSDLLENITGQTNNIYRLLQDDFQCDLAMDLVKFYCKFAGRINNDYQHLKDNFISHLEDKGYTISSGENLDKYDRKDLKEIYQSIRHSSERDFQKKVKETKLPTPEELQKLEKAKTKTKSECIQEYKGKLARNYKTEQITAELIALDREGLYPKLLLRFWLLFGEEEAIKRDKRVLTRYAQNNEKKGYAIDFNSQSKSTQAFLLNHIGLAQFLDNVADIQNREILNLLLSMQFNPIWFKAIDFDKLSGWISSSYIIPYLSFLENEMVKKAFKQALNIDLEKKQSPIQLLRMILSRIGYGIAKVGRLGSRSYRQRFYRITDSISEELRYEIFSNWVDYENRENAKFSEEMQAAA